MYQWKLEFGMQPTIYIKADDLEDAIGKSKTAYTPLEASFFNGNSWVSFTRREIAGAVCTVLKARRLV
jgi:hypothetical protein